MPRHGSKSEESNKIPLFENENKIIHWSLEMMRICEN